MDGTALHRYVEIHPCSSLCMHSLGSHTHHVVFQQDLWRQQQGCAAALASHPISVPAEVSPLQPAPRAEGKPGQRGKRRSEADDLLAEVRV